MEVTKRRFLGATGTGIVAALGLTQLTGQSQATGIRVREFRMPDLQKSVHAPINKARTRVSGQWSIDAQTLPTRIVLRFEAKRRTSRNYQQLAAQGYRSDLSKTMRRDYSLKGNLLDLAGLEAVELSPQTVGESKSVTIDYRLRLSVYGDSGKLETHNVEDSAEITVTHTQPKVNVSVSGSGNVTLGTTSAYSWRAVRSKRSMRSSNSRGSIPSSASSPSLITSG